MEDTLRVGYCIRRQLLIVLILVLMEDTLREPYTYEVLQTICSVLILVLMEDTLRVVRNITILGLIIVLILVLMEDTLRD